MRRLVVLISVQKVVASLRQRWVAKAAEALPLRLRPRRRRRRRMWLASALDLSGVRDREGGQLRGREVVEEEEEEEAVDFDLFG